MCRQEWGSAETYRAVVLHDAEDLVHPLELRIFSNLIGQYALIQLPVLPLKTAGSRWISGHYLDEFAQAHSRDLVVRNWMGAGLPAAGVGCAICRRALAQLAQENGAQPFPLDSLTEDYELGLRLGEQGAPSAFVRVVDPKTGTLVATQAHFPDRLKDAVRQKARWTIGIALAGWDRLGWRARWDENWMRWRDRRALFAALIHLAAYLTILLTGLLFVYRAHQPVPQTYIQMLQATSLLLGWRLGIRALCVGRHYGWQSALLSIPRATISNIVAILAARDAFIGYVAYLRTGRLRWHKTHHRSPLDP